jgi:hypothetical protein
MNKIEFQQLKEGDILLTRKGKARTIIRAWTGMYARYIRFEGMTTAYSFWDVNYMGYTIPPQN